MKGVPALMTSVALAVFSWWVSTVTDGQAGEMETIRIGVCLSLTGEFAEYGAVNLAGIQLFTDDYNADAARHGRTFELVIRDDKSDAAEAVAITRDLAVNENIQVIIGPVTSPIMLAMSEATKEHPVVLISPGATSPLLDASHPWCFKILPGDDYQGVALAQFFARHMGTTRAALVVNTHFDYGRHLADAFTNTYAELGGKITAQEHYDWNLMPETAPDFSVILKRIAATKPELIVLPGYAKEAVECIRQAENLDIDAVFVGSDSWLNHQDIYQAGPRLDDSYYIGNDEVYSGTEAARRFSKLLDASDDPTLKPYCIDGYDCMLLITHTIESGARSAVEIREKLFSLRRFPLATGAVTFDQTKGTAKTLHIYRISRSGESFFAEMVARHEPE